ncbi:hypothetical protein D2H34_004512 [Vibrio fluvialis]|nr:hypothetical protein [Vibrio fluvialis]
MWRMVRNEAQQARTKAVEDMQKILDALKKPDDYVCFSSGDITNIQRVLGIDLWKSTLGRQAVKKMVRGKVYEND